MKNKITENCERMNEIQKLEQQQREAINLKKDIAFIKKHVLIPMKRKSLPSSSGN